MKDQENQEPLDSNKIANNSEMQPNKGAAEGIGPQELDQEYLEEPQDNSQLSQIKSLVSKDPKQSMMMLIVLGLIVAGIGYYFFSDGSSKKSTAPQNNIPLRDQHTPVVGNITAPKVSGSLSPPPSYDIAIDPELVKPKVEKPEVKAEAPIVEKSKAVDPKDIAQKKEGPVYEAKPALLNAVIESHSEKPILDTKHTVVTSQHTKDSKLKSSIMLTGASGSKAADATTKTRDISSNFTPEASASGSSRLTTVGNMARLITQGKIIETVLETPANTNYPGPIRAVISRDVYSESGDNVLIPKGSRVIGAIAGGYQAGQTRLLIVWNRIILPSGYDIKVEGAPGVGDLGTIGIEGIVDRQILNTIGNAVLISALNIGMAKVIEKEMKVGSSTSTSTVAADGTQTTNSTTSPTQQAAQTELNNFSNATKDFLKNNFVTKPFIDIDQGTIVKIFVNADIQFPDHLSSGINILR